MTKTAPSLKPSRTRKARLSTPALTPPVARCRATGERTPPAPLSSRPPTGKLAVLAELMLRAQGASIADMAAATGWQAHSVRGALAGALKIKHGLTITSEKAEGGRVYRVAAPSAEGADA